MKPVALLLIAALLAPPAFAETPYIETFEVRLHNLDVVVTDAKGHPVRGLTKDDFQITENGASQEVTNFAIYDASAATATASSTTAAPAEGQGEATVSAPPPRRIIFFLDEIAVQKMVRNRLYSNLKTFVDAMRPGDLAAVVRPTTQEKIVQQFTGDKAAIEAALKQAIDESEVRLVGQKREVAALRSQLLNSAASPNAIRFAKREYADAAARRVEHRLGQIRALTTSLAGVQGKKILVLVSMGLSAKPGYEAWDSADTMSGGPRPMIIPVMQADPNGIEPIAEVPPPDDPENTYRPIVHDLTSAIRDIGRSAAANGVTIYALEPDVPLDLGAHSNVSVPVKSTRGGGALPDKAYDLSPAFQIDTLNNSQITLASLTETTGGKWFRGISSIDDTFRQVEEDVSFYYSLAYRATGDADKARKVNVRVRNHPELRVRTRSEVLEKSTEREMGDLVVASLLYPRTVNELGINVSAGKPQKERGLFTVPIDVIIPLKNLTFLKDDTGKYVASFDLHYAAAGEQRDFGSGGQRQQLIEISPEQYGQIGNTNYRYKTGIQVSPGRARIAIGVLDTATKLTGFRTVEVIAQ